MKTLLLIFLLLSTDTSHALVQPGECVILLHGLGRTEGSMKDIQQALETSGYSVWNQGYPSTEYDIPTLAQDHVGRGVSHCQNSGASAVHFVTHSLGGILVRQFLQDNTIAGLGKIVMLAPPNHGSEVTDELKGYKWFRAVMGPAAQQLGTDEKSVPNNLKPIPGTIGVISGNSSSDPWFSWMFSGPTDGKVSVESARLDEMVDFLVVDEGHTFVMSDDEVIRQILFFLNTGVFDVLVNEDSKKLSRKPGGH